MPLFEDPVPTTAKVAEAKLGQKTTIEGIGLYDTEQPGTGNLLGWAGFPGNGKVVWYPECVPLAFPAGAIEIRRDEHGPQFRARPNAACITEEDRIHFHPPAGQPGLLALARLCEEFAIPFDAPDAAARLALELARCHRPEAFLPAGRELTADERRMSIAWMIDQEQGSGETVPSVLARIRIKLVENGLIEADMADSTLHRLAKQGARLLAQRGMTRWRSRSPGRPRMGTQPVG